MYANGLSINKWINVHVCLFHLKTHLQLCSWEMSPGVPRLFLFLNQRGNLSARQPATSRAALLVAAEVLHGQAAAAAPVWTSWGQLISWQLQPCKLRTSGHLGAWSEDRKIDHKQFVRHSVFQLLSRCASFCIPGIFPTVRRVCHVFKQNASSHAQSWHPLSFTINFSFLGNRSSHYPPEALTSLFIYCF